MNWHRSFMIALIEENEETLLSLLDSMPQFENSEQMQSALELISQATKIFERKKEDLFRQMRKIENEKKFVTSSSHPTSSHLDIHS